MAHEKPMDESAALEPADPMIERSRALMLGILRRAIEDLNKEEVVIDPETAGRNRKTEPMRYLDGSPVRVCDDARDWFLARAPEPSVEGQHFTFRQVMEIYRVTQEMDVLMRHNGLESHQIEFLANEAPEAANPISRLDCSDEDLIRLLGLHHRGKPDPTIKALRRAVVAVEKEEHKRLVGPAKADGRVPVVTAAQRALSEKMTQLEAELCKDYPAYAAYRSREIFIDVIGQHQVHSAERQHEWQRQAQNQEVVAFTESELTEEERFTDYQPADAELKHMMRGLLDDLADGSTERDAESGRGEPGGKRSGKSRTRSGNEPKL